MGGQESRCKPLLQYVAFSKGLSGQRPETPQEVPLEGDQTINPHAPNKSPSEYRHASIFAFYDICLLFKGLYTLRL